LKGIKIIGLDLDLRINQDQDQLQDPYKKIIIIINKKNFKDINIGMKKNVIIDIELKKIVIIDIGMKRIVIIEIKMMIIIKITKNINMTIIKNTTIKILI
jgi:hypothetical protein